MANAMVLLQEVAASSQATVDLTSWYSSSYESYLIEFIDILPATDGQLLRMVVSTDGGSNWDTGNNYAVAILDISDTSTILGAVESYGFCVMGPDQQRSDGTYGGVCGNFMLYNPGNSSGFKHLTGDNTGWDNRYAYPTVRFNIFVYKSSSAVNGLRFLFGSGNITSGTFKIYGMTK